MAVTLKSNQQKAIVRDFQAGRSMAILAKAWSVSVLRIEQLIRTAMKARRIK